jgi:hypothetical protein
MVMKSLGRRIEKLEALTELTRGSSQKRAMEYFGTLDQRTLRDLILFFWEQRCRRESGDGEAEARIKEKIERYCEGRKVKIIDASKVSKFDKPPFDRLIFTTTRNPNPPDFRALSEFFKCLEEGETK